VNDTQAAHPAADELTAFAQGRLGPARQAEIERHVAGCDRCCRALRAVPDDTFLTALREAPTPPGVWRPTPAGDAVPPELRDHPRYRVLGTLGAGGTGVVYRAEHRLMERPVALKVLNVALLSRPGAVQRFRREAQAAARLSHPNIVAVYDAEQAGGLHFLVREYVEGISLARLVQKRGPLAVAHACHFAGQAALGLQHAHERGLFHGAVQPHNLLVTRHGQVKVLDFGLARLEVGDAQREDARADVYGLGATLYFLLAARPPLPDGSPAGQAAITARRDVPAGLAAVLERMLAEDPDRRYQTPAEVAEALAPFVQTGVAGPGGVAQVVGLPEVAAETQPLRPRSGGGRRGWLILLLVGLGLLLTVGLLLGYAVAGTGR
jgi:hypothetical protein